MSKKLEHSRKQIAILNSKIAELKMKHGEDEPHWSYSNKIKIKGYRNRLKMHVERVYVYKGDKRVF